VDNEPWPTLDEYIGICIRRYRDEMDMRAEDFARIMQQRGLHWNRGTVTAIERGKRKVSAGELIALVNVVPVDDYYLFFHHPRISLVNLADDLHISTNQLEHGLDGFRGEGVKQDLDFMTANVLAGDPDRRIDGQDLIRTIVASGGSFTEALAKLSDAERFVLGTYVSEADRRASQRFDVPPEIVTLASHGLWGHGLETERDQPDAHGSKSHSTRELYKSLEMAIADRS